jgi:hypothetical protein
MTMAHGGTSEAGAVRCAGRVLVAASAVVALALALGTDARAGEPTGEFRFFEWDSSGRRDPFEFRGPDIARVPTPLPTPIGPTPAPVDPTPPENAASAKEIRQFAERRAREAEQAIGYQQFARAEEAAQEAIGKLGSLQIPDAVVAERLNRALRTAQRLRSRDEIEKEFKGVKIEIQGIIWSPETPMALIKGQMVGEGETVEGALVEEIRTDEIIFNYKGIRCSRGPGL